MGGWVLVERYQFTQVSKKSSMTDLICLFSLDSLQSLVLLVLKIPTNLVDFLLSIDGSMTYLTLIVTLSLDD